MLQLLRLLRPKHWIKNTFVFAALLFSRQLFDGDFFLSAFYAFVVFCLASSCVYIINDICDRKKDALSPTKKHRPIASGKVRIGTALLFLSVLIVVCMVLLVWHVSQEVSYIVIAYIALNTVYSAYLKHLFLLDIFIISAGFLLRTYAGALAIGVELSHWMLSTVLCLTLFLGGMKRRQELFNNRSDYRPVLHHYSIPFLDKLLLITSISTFVFYSLYVTLISPRLFLTLPLVLYGLLRYLKNIEDNIVDDPVSDLFSDKVLAMTVLLWCVSVVLLL